MGVAMYAPSAALEAGKIFKKRDSSESMAVKLVKYITRCTDIFYWSYTIQNTMDLSRSAKCTPSTSFIVFVINTYSTILFFHRPMVV